MNKTTIGGSLFILTMFAGFIFVFNNSNDILGHKNRSDIKEKRVGDIYSYFFISDNSIEDGVALSAH